MKKNLLVVFVVMAMLMMFAGTVSAAPLSAGAPTLVSANAGPGGTVFIFSVTGEFSRSQLKGTAHVEGGNDYGLSCTQVDDSTVRCTASRKVQGNVVVTFGGSTFWTNVTPYVAHSASYCYDVYDYDYDTESYWMLIGTNCQDSPASYGDIIYDFYNWDWDGYYDYEFMPNSPVCPFSQSGDAYYYNGCPS